MISTSKQLKDLIRNLSKEKSADSQILLRNYMMERLLERIAISSYKDNFILKGGMLIAAMVGVDLRATMDLDATLKSHTLNLEEVEKIVKEIIEVDIQDGVEFRIESVKAIMDEADYPGVRVSLKAAFDGTLTPIKIDISTGDIITPREVRYSFKLMLEDRDINIWAYNLETILAEKIETVISRDITNTRMRDFYDIHVLNCIYGNDIDKSVLREAVYCTSGKRGSVHLLVEAMEVFEDIREDREMQNRWKRYQDKFNYANDISWEDVIGSLKQLYLEI